MKSNIMPHKKAIALLSGGLDSVTLAHLLKAEGYDLHLLAIDYGQRHKKELRFAEYWAQCLHAEFHSLDLSSLTHLLAGSALTDAIEVPEGHYAEESMKLTIVPNRNAIMLTIAYGVAVAEKAAIVAAGMHAGDHHIYPDCRPVFTEAFDTMQRSATEGCGVANLRLVTPFLHMEKSQIVSLASTLGIDLAQTWSCYKGGERHCGRCGTCVERKLAFRDATVPDPTQYEDTAYMLTM